MIPLVLSRARRSTWPPVSSAPGCLKSFRRGWRLRAVTPFAAAALFLAGCVQPGAMSLFGPSTADRLAAAIKEATLNRKAQIQDVAVSAQEAAVRATDAAIAVANAPTMTHYLAGLAALFVLQAIDRRVGKWLDKRNGAK